MIRARLGGCVGALAVCLCCPALALGAAGATIASAPGVTYGQQEFGNLLQDASVCTGDQGCQTYWQLNVTAGDHIKIDFHSATTESALVVGAYAVGTTDYNRAQTSPEFSDESASTGYGELTFVAPRTGMMPLDMYFGYDAYQGQPGPYDFTAYVSHAMLVSIAPHNNPATHTTALQTAVHNPDGVPISVQGLTETIAIKYHGQWETAWTGAASASKTIRWNATLRGHKQSVRVTMSGPSYLTASATVRVLAA